MSMLRLASLVLAACGALGLVTDLDAIQGIDLSKLGKEFERVVGKIRPSVVDVLIQEQYTDRDKGSTTVPVRRSLFRCSGVIRTRQGEVLTLLRHGLPEPHDGGAVVIEVTLADGAKYAAEFKALDPETGVTLLQIKDPPKLQVAKLAKGNGGLRPGSLVIAVGSANGLHHSFQIGIVSSLQRSVQNSDFFFPRAIQTDIFPEAGAVGGMLANTTGDMVGMLAFTLARGQGARPQSTRPVHAVKRDPQPDLRHAGGAGSVLAIPADLLDRIYRELRKRGQVTRGAVDAAFIFREGWYLQHYGVALSGGAAQVYSVGADGPAAKAGLREGDVVVQVDDRSIKQPPDLAWFAERVEYGKIGTVMNIKIFRPDTESFKTLPLRVEKRRDSPR